MEIVQNFLYLCICVTHNPNFETLMICQSADRIINRWAYHPVFGVSEASFKRYTVNFVAAISVKLLTV